MFPLISQPTVGPRCGHKTAGIAIWYDVVVNIGSMIGYFILSQSTRVTDGQNFESQDRSYKSISR